MGKPNYHRVSSAQLPSLPKTHKAVHDTMVQIEEEFIKCYGNLVPRRWTVEIEMGIWKQLMLDQHPVHFRKNHTDRCYGDLDSHARNYGYRQLMMLLHRWDNYEFDECRFERYHRMKYGKYVQRERCYDYEHDYEYLYGD